MELGLVVTLFIIGLIGSFVSGLVGIGGSIIKYPLLLYVPVALGFMGYSVQEVAAISAVQVFFASLAGMFSLRKSGCIHRRLVYVMGGTIVVGSFIGGYGSKWLPDAMINLTYALLATVALMMMLLPKKAEQKGHERDLVDFNRWLAGGISLCIGLLSGIVGAAGAFITIPVMLVLLKIPTRVAIASSLAITFLSSIGATAGKIAGGHLLLIPSIIMVVASLIAAPIGARLSMKVNTKVLQWILIVLIGGTVIKIWLDLI